MNQIAIDKDVYSIILSGGSGTRLWPLSRQALPKQFIQLGGLDKSLLQLCLDRVKHISLPANRWIITAKGQEELCKRQLSDQKDLKILVEPTARNTAPAIAFSAWKLLKENTEAIMVILPSDHAIQNTRSFEHSISDAIRLARQNLFVTLGIQPTHPATGFGYIEQGLPLDEEGNIILPMKLNETRPTGYSVRSFREKPNQAVAEQFLRTGKYLWNAGMFVWKAQTFWNAFSHLQPEMAAMIESLDSGDFEKKYASLQNISIDVAFIEQTSHVACVPATFDWNDVGSWSAVRDCFSQDANGNSVSGNILALETKNSVLHSTGPFVSVVGMENVAVVATPDGVLVMPLDRSQDVKKIIPYLEANHAKLL